MRRPQRMLGAVLAVALLLSACAPGFDGIVTLEGPGLELTPQPEAVPSTIVAADGTVLATLRREYRERVRIGDVPQVLLDAVVAAEDRRFWQHAGVDAEAVARAAVRNIIAGEVVEGGSTISQQLVELRFMPPATDTLGTKAAEAALALQLEEDFPKEWILEEYLNTVYLGGGAHGVGAAAWSYFRAEPSQLTLGQAALLAGLIRTPGTADPRVDPVAARMRRDTVLQLMVETGVVDAAAAAAAAAEPIVVREAPAQPARLEPHWVDLVVRTLLVDASFGVDESARWRRLTGGGLRIETTLDLDAQAAARDALAVELTGTAPPDGAVVVLDPQSGAILAAVGSLDYESLQFDLATQAVRQPGSVFKGMTLTAALADGYTGTTMIDARGGRMPSEVPWSVRGSGRSRSTLQTALWRSDNAAFARLGLSLGVERVAATARSLGVTSPLGDNPSVLLGGTETCCTVLEFASAYGTLAAMGTHAPPSPIARVLDADGAEVWSPPAGALVLDEVVAFDAISLLEGVVTSGTGRAARVPGHTIAGKTGTSSDNADGWFVGSSPTLTAAVWVGHHDARRTARVRGVRVSGGGPPARIFARVMGAVLGPGPGPAFALPERRTVELMVDVETGLLPSPWCGKTELRTFPDARAPREACPSPSPSPIPVPPPSPAPSPSPAVTPSPDPDATPTPDATGTPTPPPTPPANPSPTPTPGPTPPPPPGPTPPPAAP